MSDVIFDSLYEIVTFFNRPRQDKAFLQKAGVELDPALFPIVVRVGVHKKIGVGELADQLGRDYSTVSRQVDKLETLHLVTSAASKADKRVREIQLSPPGKTLVAKIGKARRALMAEALANWDAASLAALQSSLQRLAQSLAERRAND